MRVSVPLVPRALELASADQHHVHQLLQGVDEEEPGQHQDLSDGQSSLREGAPVQTDVENLVTSTQISSQTERVRLNRIPVVVGGPIVVVYSDKNTSIPPTPRVIGLSFRVIRARK